MIRSQASPVASGRSDIGPRSYRSPRLAPNGTHFVSGTALAAGDSSENVDRELPVASAKPLKVSAIGLAPTAQGAGFFGGRCLSNA